MIELGGIQLGTIFQGGTFLAIIVAAFTALGIWFKHGPDRKRAANESDQIKIDEAEQIRTDYAAQIRDFRKEVHGYRNELATVQARLASSESTSRQRSDRINNMMFIIRLLISELERLDQGSIIVKQAKAMLAQMDPADPSKSTALNAAESAVDAAKATVKEVKQSEIDK